jgi:quercetin dioxygenase-like cupin family protein
MSIPDANSVTYHRWDQIPAEPLKGTITRRMVTGTRTMIAHIYLKKGDDVPRHSHDNEQLTYVLEGTLRLWFGPTDEREITVRAGEVVVIPPNVPHRALALEDTLDVDVFSPPREDWLKGTDAYLRR